MADKIKILLVDDNLNNLFSLEAILEELDVSLYKAQNGFEALRLADEHDFALALIDIQMPEMDGYELAEKLRANEKTASIPFIFISAISTDYINVFKGYEKGAFSFIIKPFQPAVLLNKVNLFIKIHEHESLLNRLNKDLEEKNYKLKLLNNDLNSFNSSVSHDLRAPLRAINSYAEILNNEYGSGLDDEGRKLLSYILENGEKMGNLIEALLNFSRLGNKEINKTKVNMQALMNSVINEQKSYGAGNVEWLVSPLYDCYADPNLLRQVVRNLLSNAVKYTQQVSTPTVKIGADRMNGKLIYYFKDNGVGFDMKDYDKLFGFFQRLHDDEFEGNGVGLAMVKKIITRHYGEVWADGKPGNGASFYFCLPDIKDEEHVQ